MNLGNKLRTIRSTWLLNCREAGRLQSAGLDRSLPLRQRLALRLHVLICRWCRRYGWQIRFLHRAARQQAEKITETLPNQLSAAARERIKQSLITGKTPPESDVAR